MSNITPSPENSGEFFSYEQWRERFLKVILQGSCILGFAAVALYLLTPASALYKILAIATYGILVLMTLFTHLSYTLRAGVFLFLLFFAGLSSLFDYGIADASILFLGFIVMTGLLFSPRVGLYSIIALAALISLVLWLPSTSLVDTARLTAILLIVSIIIGIGLHTFQDEFTNTQRTARQTLDILREERSRLEERVEERTVGLTRKTEQLRATSYIARKIAEVQDLGTLLDTVAHLVTDQFGFYHTGVFLINESGNQVVLHAASSEGGRRMLERGHSFTIGMQGIVGYVAAQKKSLIALDVGADAVLFNNPDLPLTRSEVALPLLIRNKILGVLDIQSDRPQAFSMDDIDVLQTLSDQIAIAIENARLLDETQAAIMQLEALTSIRTQEAWIQKLQDQNRAFTYTPIGLRAEKLPQHSNNTIRAPIVLRGQKIGNIAIARKGDGKWSRLDERLLEEVANQVGLAVDHIRLLEEATQRARQEQTVGKLAARFSQSLDLDTLLQTAARELGQLPDVSEVAVFIGQDDRQTAPKNNTHDNWKKLTDGALTGSLGYRFDNVRLERITEIPQLAGAALSSGMIVNSNGKYSQMDQERSIAFPIKLRGQTIGVISLKLEEGYDRNTVSIVESAAERLASAMESARLYEEARLRADREQSISRVTTAISASTGFEQILQTTVREIGNILGDTDVAIQILDEPSTVKRATGQGEP